jgi:hypothetical protein
MKHLYAFGLLVALGLSAQAQVVFQSGFETWTDNVPTDWNGARTSLPTTGMAQVSDNVHGGSFAVRLTNAASGHLRFTTQDVAVVAGQTYEVRFWARGNGEVRLGLYDGRPGNGYSSYTGYTTLSGPTWTEVVLTVACTNDTTAGQFILSLRNTVEPEHLVVDDVTISTTAPEEPTPATIAEIQGNASPEGASNLDGVLVQTSGIVTGVVSNASGTVTSYFIQDGTGAHSGIYVFGTPPTAVAMGDDVTLVGRVDEFNDLTEIVGVTSLTVNSSGNTLPAAENLSAADAATEPWEGVLVRVVDLRCNNLPDNTNNFQWLASNWQGSILVNDLIYDSTPTVGNYYSVTGLVNYNFSEWKLEPRMESDIEASASTGVSEVSNSTLRTYPNPASTALFVDLSALEGRSEVELVDATGRVALRTSSGNNLLQVDVNSVATGMYTLTLRNNGQVISRRVSVHH